jgi:nitroreductase
VEVTTAVRRRRMTRSFRPDGLARAELDAVLDLARRAPTAGNTAAVSWLVLDEPDAVARYWDVTLPPDRRVGFRWQGLLRAPALVVVLTRPDAYVARYAEPDKARTGLGTGPEAWPTPYWTIDASMAVMTLLLAAEDAGLGALLFAVFDGEEAVRAELHIPAHLQLLGAIALGWPARDEAREGASAARPRRAASEIIHRGGW